MPSRRALLATALLGGAAACAPGPAPPPQTPAVVAPKVVPAIPELGQAAPEATVSALVEACVAPRTGDVERARITQYLASIKSAAGERCYLHALREYRPGVTDEIVGVASEAVAALRIEAARGPLFEAFTKMRASRSHGAYRAVYDAMVALADPAWEGRLVAYLERPVDPKDPPAFTDEMFWLQTAITILGRQRSEAAVRPLLRVLLTPDRALAQLDALLALVRIGKPAVVAATTLLKKGDPELLAHAAARATSGVDIAAMVLATIGRAESVSPMLDSIAAADPVTRALVARELSKLPTDARVVAAYRGVVEKLPLTVMLPLGPPAHEDLVGRAPEFFDANLVPWLVDDARRLKGDPEKVRMIREAALVAALELARADQVKDVDAIAALGNAGKSFAKPIAMTKELLAACGDRVDCWLDEVVDPASQQESTQFRGVKAAYMIGVLGDASAKAKLVAAMPQITNPAVRYVAGLAILHLSPQGDAAAAAALQKMIDEADASGDPGRVRLHAPLKVVVARLQSRVP